MPTADANRWYVATVLAMVQEAQAGEDLSLPGYYVTKVTTSHPWMQPNTWEERRRVKPTPQQVKIATRLAALPQPLWPKRYQYWLRP